MAAEKSLSEIAGSTRKTAAFLHPVKLISPEFITISSSDSPYTVPVNLRSVTFILWGISSNDTVSIVFPNTTKLFDDAKYEGFIFSYAIDITRDCKLVSDITITITGDATVDIVYTTD